MCASFRVCRARLVGAALRSNLSVAGPLSRSASNSLLRRTSLGERVEEGVGNALRSGCWIVNTTEAFGADVGEASAVGAAARAVWRRLVERLTPGSVVGWFGGCAARVRGDRGPLALLRNDNGGGSGAVFDGAFYLTNTMIDDIDNAATQHGLTKSDLVRQAIDEWLHRNPYP
jgi:hypothetical protein